MTSPYQMAPAEAATKLRFSSGMLAEPLAREMPCCCSSRWMAERDSWPWAASPLVSSSSLICRTERRGLSCLALRISVCSAAPILE